MAGKLSAPAAGAHPIDGAGASSRGAKVRGAARGLSLRRPGVAATVLLVAAAHLWLADVVMEDRLGFGASSQSGIRRIDVAYVRELALAPPPEAPPAPAPAPKPRPRRAAAAKAPPASAPASAPKTMQETVVAQAEPSPAAPAAESAAAAAPAAEPAPSEPAPPAPAAAAPASAAAPSTPSATPAAAAPASAASAPAPQPFEWPPSTRLAYVLAGNYRGEVQGNATVEWIRVGLRYQVHLQATVGAPFAPLMMRRVSSDGELGERGLTPRKFDAEQRVAFRSKRWAMSFEPDRVLLPEGREAPAVPGVQDEASLFVQLTWIFTTQPQLLQVGRTIDIPLALPRRVEVWQYDVVGEEVLKLPFALVPTVHVKPRRLAKPGGDMTAEIWFAPGLQYLPVRILIHQDPQTFVDLMLERAPQQSAQR